MTYTITLTLEEVIAIREAVFARGSDVEPLSAELARLEYIYGKLLELTASDDVARRMQDEGDKYGHD